jgi:NADPH:quinone reductase-like Zn-dependent oxidoreductase
MRALTLTGLGGLEHLAVQDVPAPTIRADDEVLVRVRCAALNRIDLWMTAGLPSVKPVFPHVVGSDGAGVVESVGPAAGRWQTGDPVMINPGISCGHCPACETGEEGLCSSFGILGEHLPGTAAELVVVPASNLGRVPEGMSWSEAAGFPLATLTAWRMLVGRARLQAGETVLIWGIGGGVGMAALQIAVTLGARAVVTSGSDAKLEVAARLGAALGVNHRSADVVAEVRRDTGGRGAHVVVDCVGEATWANSLRALRRGGRLVVCGATTGPSVSLDLRRLFWHQWSVLGSTMGNHREFATIVQLAQEGRLWPVVDSVVPMEEGSAAYSRMQRGEQTGKLVIEVSS